MGVCRSFELSMGDLLLEFVGVRVSLLFQATDSLALHHLGPILFEQTHGRESCGHLFGGIAERSTQHRGDEKCATSRETRPQHSANLRVQIILCVQIWSVGRRCTCEE
jgi:hypothetical protein